ncbi:selenocysteine-specific translation elongation factor [Candidatus Arthromitus sp. SFB-turkey]|uniref:selenocysteine-specific translation elongation factor n=1 Tax=Candidatus Arthromitus sp. SFB-turkey TaxID=1840217 RepID=UPI0007F49807|nr:selenocysteine-specific translation elongation factor [Candidatus Arthromitus sp. SFB-turkey]OAT88003.1 selenocysteine-specific translation factor [Candidatus Arthromitus sp. SFB-turkey]
MKNIIIGTAGHVDHGKTSLIKLLTNIDTDSLAEEKKRGISINLGFAFFDLPSKRRAGIIDVPGHEKFIKNMLAGATGIDVVLLVVACDEVVKPQTREHLDILSMLNIKKGIVVLTKRDLVDDDWYELVKEEVREEISHTFLKDSKIIAFSSKTKIGYDELVNEIDRILDEDFEKIDNGIFRMPIDRCFTVSGFGTVVTGTIISGKIGLNESVVIYPNQIEAKVRNIQVYEENCEEALAGQRCALNLSNIKKEDIERGFVVSKKDVLIPSYMIDCKFYSLSNLDKNILNRQRIRFFHGTSEIIGRIHILDKSEIQNNSEAYVQFHLEKPIVSLKDDRYVVRLYSPMITIGGGYIINPVAKRVKGNKDKYLESIKIKEKQFGTEYMSLILKDDKDIILSVDDICEKYLLSKDNVDIELKKMVNNNIVIEFEDGFKKYFVHKDNLEKIFLNMKDILSEYHQKNKFRIGFLKEELKNKIGIKNLKPKIYDRVLDYFEKEGFIKLTSKYVLLSDFDIKFSDDIQKMVDSIIEEYKIKKFIPPKIKDLEVKFNSKYFAQIHEYLEDIGILYKLNPEMYLLKEDFLYAKDKIVEFLKNNGFIELKDAKEILNSNRKYLVILLEHFDELKITRRDGDKRVLF